MQKPQHRTLNDNASFMISSEIMPNRLSRVNVIGCGTKIGDMTKFISKSDLAEILDNVFSKYDIEMTETEPVKVIKKTSAKSKKTSSVKSQAKSDEFVIDGEKFTLNGVFTTKGATYKAQTAGGAKLTTMVVQVTQSQKDAWESWRKN
jgi:hypothetical protein